MTLITFVMVAIFGTLTLVFHNDLFIKWKVTVIYALFSIALLVSQIVLKKPLIQRMLGKDFSARRCMVALEYGLGAVLYGLRSCQYLRCVLDAAKRLG